MIPPDLEIRPMTPQDNPAVKALVIETLAEMGYSGPGYACNDPELEDMAAAYEGDDCEYWVIVDRDTQTVLGGGGISRLRGAPPEAGICELQKLYFRPALRGRGMGQTMLTHLMTEAARTGYREMYLESLPTLTAAIRLYEKFGFTYLTGPKGNTGHQERCSVWMSRLLAQPSLVERR